ncbi:hypothetical protein [Lyngbya aestuarii]|uniref:hypothetical protein n=1 Tax=Lyngbya aestuarii TaxID=118322 RepID=UPI00403D9014
MTPAEIEAFLKVAFVMCEVALCPLTDQQREILLQVVAQSTTSQLQSTQTTADSDSVTENPLNEMTPEQRQALLLFVKEQQQQGVSWKIRLLNDWLHSRESGAVQFIHDQYGPQWLNRIKPLHLAQYWETETPSDRLNLKIGDRIEVSNGLWEWVQESGPCQREWFPCTVVGLSQSSDGNRDYCNCIVRFDNGIEYEIQGIYQWNLYNWRWAS